MSSVREPAEPLSGVRRRNREALIEDFELAWQRGERPHIDAFLGEVAGSDRRALLLELTHAELEFRLKAGETCRVEEYLRRYPELGDEPSVVLELAAAELSFRRRREPGVSAAEYVTRFPLLGSRLRQDERFRTGRRDEPAGPAPASPPGYEILNELGRGGMGVVYRARQLKLGRLVALKMILAGSHAGSAELARFRREAEAVARLQHPAFVQVFDVGEHNGLPYLSLEYVAGGSLAQRLDGTPVAAREAAGLVQTLARAMEFAHRQGIVHRDLKPANILLEPEPRGPSGASRWGEPAARTVNDGFRRNTKTGSQPRPGGGQLRGQPGGTPDPAGDARPTLVAPNAVSDPPPAGPTKPSAALPETTDAVNPLPDAARKTSPLAGLSPKITDFGLALRLDAGSTACTRSGAIIGTPSYMAPEQAAGHRGDVGPAADVYALGAILYELMTGRPPFKAETPFDTISQVLGDEPVPPGRLQPRLPRDLETICLRCLQKNQARRYPCADALADDLGRFLDGRPILARPTGYFERLGKWVWREPVLSALVGAVTLVIGCSFVVVVWLLVREAKARAHAVEKAEDERLAKLTAEQAQLTAEREARDAVRARAETLVALREARTSFYLSQISQAEREQLAGNPRRAADLLDGCPKEVRGWEWGYLSRLAKENCQTIPGSGRPLTVVAISPDGRTLAAAGDDGSIRVWHGAPGSLHTAVPELLSGHTAPVTGLAFSSNNQTLASAAADGVVRVWDVVSHRQITALPSQAVRDQDRRVNGVAFGPNEWLLATAGEDGTARVWNLARGTCVAVLQGHEGPVTSVAFHPDGRRLASAGSDRTVRLWELSPARELAALRQHTDKVIAVAYRPDGRTLASVGADKTVALWDSGNGQEQGRFSSGRAGLGFAFSPTGDRLAVVEDDGAMTVWDPLTGRSSFSLGRPDVRCTAAVFSRDGERIITACRDGSVRLWDALHGGESLRLHGHRDDVTSLAISPDGRFLASGSRDHTVHLWDARTGRLVHVCRGHAEFTSLVFARDEPVVASGSLDHTVRFWSAETGEELRRADRQGLGVTALARSPNGRLLAVADRLGVSLIDWRTGFVRRPLGEHDGTVTAVAWHPGGTAVAAGGADAGFVLWPVTGSPPPIRVKEAHGLRTLAVAWSNSPAGLLLATGGEDGLVKFWTEAGELVRVLRGHSGPVTCLAFTPGGDRVVSGSVDRTVKFWDPASGREALTVREATEVYCLTFSPDGRTLVVGGADRALSVRTADASR